MKKVIEHYGDFIFDVIGTMAIISILTGLLYVGNSLGEWISQFLQASC